MRLTSRAHTLYIYMLMLLATAACTAEDEDVPAVPTGYGVLQLAMQSDEVYITTTTRSAVVSDYAFTLDGTTPITFTADGKTIVEEGTHTLSATNAAKVNYGYYGILFSGETTFSITAGGTTTVTIDMGKPKNSKVSYEVSDQFDKLYTVQSITIVGATHTHTLSAPTDKKYVAAETITYAISDPARAGSHVQEFNTITQTFTTEAGKHHIIRLDADTISGYIRIDIGDGYDGEFE